MSALRAAKGDRLIVHGRQVGAPERDGEIIEVVGSAGAPPYVVRWDDGRVSRLYPGPDASVRHYTRP